MTAVKIWTTGNDDDHYDDSGEDMDNRDDDDSSEDMDNRDDDDH